MSAPAAGKYQDHYQILGVDPKADSETIQKAYAKLAQVYNPKNRETGDAEKFEAVNLAYEVLADPELRAGFDQMKGVKREEGVPKFSGQVFFDALGREVQLRSALLCVLYDRRRSRPLTPSLSVRQLENILDTDSEELSAVLWYLKQRGFVRSDDKSSLQITVEGVDFLDSKKPSPEEVIPLIKASAIQEPPAPPQTPAPAASEPESVISILNRARSRS